MVWTQFTTAHLQGAQRYESWESMASQSLFRSRFTGPHLHDFLARSSALDLGNLQTFAQSLPPLEANRPPALIRQADPEVVHLWLTRRGLLGLSQSGRDVMAGEGDFVLYDSSRPCRGFAKAPDGQDIAGVIVQVPRALLPLHPNTLDALTITRIPGNTAIGTLLRTYLTDLMAHAPSYGKADAPRLGSATLDLLTVLLARTARDGRCLTLEARHTALRARIGHFIQQRLAEPDLTPASIAAAHRISVRYLHKLYQDDRMTVSALIRHTRLERIRRDLSDPRLGARCVSAIAARWGFPEPAHFSRAFRSAYGVTPSEYRRHALPERVVH
ncbi:helix-turn-helix domain-containing protein [Streptomyces sp. C]|uniref:helix-turn-helix domain-containing protein n=1 Tax=Streptomyces sp. C TaxID=253839 RepID=UPI0001B58708|nr:helix-turn-helix domain-containing protein [Streptomyces sp. C]EFL12843.1 predicted protein [Streptomyces sp. C]